MPINGMLTLADVAGAHQQGIEDRQRNADADRAQKAQAVYDGANQAAAAVVDKSKAQWAISGAQGDYKPSDDTMLKSAEARGQHFASAGDWDGFFKNEGAVQGQRMRVRQGAFERYNLDGDVQSLARAIGPTVFSGKQISGTELVKGGPKDALKGAPSGPDKLRVTYDDGTSLLADPQEFVNKLKLSLTDPAKMAELDAKLSFLSAQERIKTKGQIEVAGETGRQSRLTEGVKGDNQRSLADTKFVYDTQIKTLENTSRESVAAGNNAATLGAAGTAASASRYGADKRVEAAEVGAAATREKAAAVKKDDRVKTAKATQDLVIKTWGEQSGALGGGRIGNEDTLKISNYAQALMDADTNLSAGMAVQQSINEFAKRKPKAK